MSVFVCSLEGLRYCASRVEVASLCLTSDAVEVVMEGVMNVPNGRFGGVIMKGVVGGRT
jgi:hypothetical protein